MKETTPPLMEVTQALLECATAAHFEFGEDTAIVAVQHMLWQTVDLFQAVAAMGIRPENIFALGKVYSNSVPVIRTLREMGVTVTESTKPAPGEFNEYFERDVKHLWKTAQDSLSERYIKRIIVLDDAGQCITNTPQNLIRRYSIAGVEQTSLGMFVFKEKPPAFPVTSWARSALKLQIGGPLFSHCLIEKLKTEFLRGKSLQGEIGVVGLGSIGLGMANLAARDGHSVAFYDPDPDLQIPPFLTNRVTRSSSLEQLMAHCDYVVGCSGRNPFRGKWPMAHRPEIKLFSGSSGDVEFGAIIHDLKDRPSFQLADDTWDITSDDGPSGRILIAYQGYPYNFVSRTGEAVPTRIVQLETGGLLAALIQARIHLALCESGGEQGQTIQTMSPSAQRFVYKEWLRAMSLYGIDVKEDYGYDPAVLRAAKQSRWLLCNTEPRLDASHPASTSLEAAMQQIFAK